MDQADQLIRVKDRSSLIAILLPDFRMLHTNTVQLRASSRRNNSETRSETSGHIAGESPTRRTSFGSVEEVIELDESSSNSASASQSVLDTDGSVPVLSVFSDLTNSSTHFSSNPHTEEQDFEMEADDPIGGGGTGAGGGD